MEFFDLSYCRESETLVVRSWQNRYRSEVLLRFDSSIRNIETALQVSDLGGEQAGVKVCAANYSSKSASRLRAGKRL